MKYLNNCLKIKSLVFILMIFDFVNLSANQADTEKLKKLVGINLENHDFKGRSVAISNDYAVVSIYGDNTKGEDNDNVSQSGSVAIYKIVNNNWKLLKVLVSNNPLSDYDAFGYSVAIDDDYVVVGAPFENSFSVKHNVEQNRTGAVYIFKKDFGGTDNWGEIKKLAPTDLLSHSHFGISVAISSNNLIVGAHQDYYDYPEYGLRQTGSAYIYEKNKGGLDNWGEVKKLFSSDRQINNNFGNSVAINNEYVIVGAIGNDNFRSDLIGYSLYHGAAYIFQKDFGGTDNWGEIKKLIASKPSYRNLFGSSVAIKNNYITVGSPAFKSSSGNPYDENNYSSAYIFEKNQGGENNWGEVKQLIPQSLDLFNNFGCSVSISDNFIVIGSSEENYDDLNKNNKNNAGAVYVYHKNYGGIDNWGQYKKIVPYDRNADDRFGFSVALSGENLIIGAPLLDDKSIKNNIIENSGGAYIYILKKYDTINNLNLNQNIHIYPNPSTNLLHIELDETKNYKTISIYNIVGMEVYSSTINNKYLNINTLELSNGIYYLHISNELNEYITQSFVVNK